MSEYRNCQTQDMSLPSEKLCKISKNLYGTQMPVKRLQAGKNAKQDNTNNKCKFKPLDNNGQNSQLLRIVEWLLSTFWPRVSRW